MCLTLKSYRCRLLSNTTVYYDRRDYVDRMTKQSNCFIVDGQTTYYGDGHGTTIEQYDHTTPNSRRKRPATFGHVIRNRFFCDRFFGRDKSLYIINKLFSIISLLLY